MKSPSPDQPRFTCRVARGLLATLGNTDGPAPRGLGSGHVAGCADCQQFFTACDDLEAALTRDAARLADDAPSNLEHRISLAVARAVAQPEPVVKRRPALSMPIFAVLGAAACVALAFFIHQKQSEPKVAQTDLVAAIDSTREFFAAHPFRTQVLDALQPAASELLHEDPLASEVQAITADARTALNFLKLNFVPGDADVSVRRSSG